MSPLYKKCLFVLIVYYVWANSLVAQNTVSFDFSQLSGTWVKQHTSSPQIEHWQSQPDGSFTGFGADVKGIDTVVTEDLRIFHANGTWQYEAKVKNQNNGKPIVFALQNANRKKCTFSNPAHDFPQKIQYSLKKSGLRVALYGPSPMGKSITYFIDFKRAAL